MLHKLKDKLFPKKIVVPTSMTPIALIKNYKSNPWGLYSSYALNKRVSDEDHFVSYVTLYPNEAVVLRDIDGLEEVSYEEIKARYSDEFSK